MGDQGSFLLWRWGLKSGKDFHRQKAERKVAQEKAQANAHSLKKNKQINELVKARRVQGVVSRMFGM